MPSLKSVENTIAETRRELEELNVKLAKYGGGGARPGMVRDDRSSLGSRPHRSSVQRTASRPPQRTGLMSSITRPARASTDTNTDSKDRTDDRDKKNEKDSKRHNNERKDNDEDRNNDERRRQMSDESDLSDMDHDEEHEDDKAKPPVVSSIEPARLAPGPVRKTSQQETARSKRMFGMLMGTLQQFQKNITNDKEKEVAAKRESIVRRIEEKATQETQEAKELAQKLREQRREKIALLRELQAQQELVQRRKTFRRHYLSLANAIQLKTAPAIFYLPAKHNDKTTALLEETRKAMEAKYPLEAGEGDEDDVIKETSDVEMERDGEDDEDEEREGEDKKKAKETKTEARNTVEMDVDDDRLEPPPSTETV